MPKEPSRKISVPKSPGPVNDLVSRAKLIFRLLEDRRVSPLVKLIPIGSALYFIVPDLMIGPLDDAAIIWLATYLFVEMCPPDVVQEHIRAIQGLPPPDAKSGDKSAEDEIVEGEFVEDESQDK
jgi:hypothetical protein